jgi:hypothetical protein
MSIGMHINILYINIHSAFLEKKLIFKSDKKRIFEKMQLV